MKYSITAAQNGFLKQLLMVIVLAIASFLEDKANLTGVLNPAVAVVIAGLASALESHIRSASGQGLFGAVNVRQS